MTSDFDLIYPIGSIFVSFKQEPPKLGIWELMDGGYYLKTTTDDVALKYTTPLAHTHTIYGHALTVSEIPNHSHNFYGPSNMNGNPNSAEDTTTSSTVGYWRGRVGTNWGTQPTLNSGSSLGRPGASATGSGSSHGSGTSGAANVEPPYITMYFYYRIK